MGITGLAPKPETIFHVVLWVSVGLLALDSAYTLIFWRSSKGNKSSAKNLPVDDKRFDPLWTLVPVAIFLFLLTTPKFGAPNAVRTALNSLATSRP